jgi:hypothetical protein
MPAPCRSACSRLQARGSLGILRCTGISRVCGPAAFGLPPRDRFRSVRTNRKQAVFFLACQVDVDALRRPPGPCRGALVTRCPGRTELLIDGKNDGRSFAGCHLWELQLFDRVILGDGSRERLFGRPLRPARQVKRSSLCTVSCRGRSTDPANLFGGILLGWTGLRWRVQHFTHGHAENGHRNRRCAPAREREK